MPTRLLTLALRPVLAMVRRVRLRLSRHGAGLSYRRRRPVDPRDDRSLPAIKVIRVRREQALRWLADPQALPQGVAVMLGRTRDSKALLRARKQAHASGQRWYPRKVLTAAHAMDVAQWAGRRVGRLLKAIEPAVDTQTEGVEPDASDGLDAWRQQAIDAVTRTCAANVMSAAAPHDQETAESAATATALADLARLEPQLARAHVAVLPIDATQPWLIPTFLLYGDLQHEPLVPTHTAVAGSWYASHRAHMVLLGHRRVVWHVLQPPQTPQQAVDLAIEHLAYCPSLGLHRDPVRFAAYAIRLMRVRVWAFEWPAQAVDS